MLKHIRNISILVIILLIGIGIYAFRGDTARLSLAETTGTDPIITDLRREIIPTFNVKEALVWDKDGKPNAVEGLSVARFAEGLDHPRSMLRLPNGDILVAETNAPARNIEGIAGRIMKYMVDKAGAGTPSANRITLLRDGDKDGVAEERFVFLEGLNSPFGMALIGDRLFVANTDALLSYPYQDGDTKITAQATKVVALSDAGPNLHWTKNIIAGPEGKKMYVAVGSNSNIAENGAELERDRAAILEVDLATQKTASYAAGLRNPVGMDYDPIKNELWTVVNERDMAGSDLVPDYLTKAVGGSHHGWPWHYWRYVDTRVKNQNLDHRQYERRPDYALGAHVAPLGLAFSRGDALGAKFASGAFVARHGSWNRIPYSGYDVIFVPFNEKGQPFGQPITILDGFVDDDEKARGRPTMLTFDQDGALLVSDDVGGIIWRVSGKAAAQDDQETVP